MEERANVTQRKKEGWILLDEVRRTRFCISVVPKGDLVVSLPFLLEVS